MPGLGPDVFDWGLRLGLALAVGAVIGLNRELKNKPAGVRTHGLVALGAALLTMIGLEIDRTGGVPGASVGRIVQGIITGIGFLGAGVIVRPDTGRQVHGLTTAASVWFVAALGISAGAGLWVYCVGALVLSVFLLLVGGPFERLIQRRFGKRRTPAPPGPPAA